LELEDAMPYRHRSAALLLSIWLGCLAVLLGARLAAQPPQTPEPPLAPALGSPGVRDVPPGPPGVRDVPTPGTPPRVRLPPTPPVGEQPIVAAVGTHCPVDPPAPVVSIKVRVPACAASGEDLEYRIHVENHGKTPAHHVIVRNPLPANTTFVRATPPPT